MNPRIKDFAEHCDFYVGNEHYDKSYEEKQVLWVEKFAEMIVKECCAQVERQYKYATKQTSTWSMSQDVQDMLKKHFGVEE